MDVGSPKPGYFPTVVLLRRKYFVCLYMCDVKPLKFSDYTDSVSILQTSNKQYLLILIVIKVERTEQKTCGIWKNTSNGVCVHVYMDTCNGKQPKELSEISPNITEEKK